MKAFATLLLLVGCATDKPTDDSQPRQIMPKSNNPTYTLYVSNQSFDKTVVDMNVYIDDRLAVVGDFNVFSQHTWYEFKFDLAPGAHTIAVESDTVGATLTQSFDKKFGVLNFWLDSETPELFQYTASAEQPYFD